MSDVVTMRGVGAVVRVVLAVPSNASMAVGSFHPNFNDVKELLCDRPCRRPSRFSPLRDLSDAELRSLAKKHPFPDAWLAGDEACPF